MRNVCYVAILFVLQGCISATYVSNGRSERDKNSAVLVMGFEIADVPFLGLLNGSFSPEINIAKVTIKNGESSSFRWIDYGAKIRDGYVVIELPPVEKNEAYVLASYKANPVSGANFSFNCGGRKSDVYYVNKGDVFYIGHYSMHDFKISYGRISWQLNKSYKYGEALKYISSNYPELAQDISVYKPTQEIVNVGARGC